MKKSLFTDTMIKRLKPEPSDYCRSEGNGFTVRVMPSGVKTWLYLYAFDGKRRKMNLGSYPDVTLETARTKFEDARRQVRNGVDPVSLKEQQKEDRLNADTISDLITEYIEKHAMPHKRGWKEDKRILEYDALPAWGKRKAADISKRDVVLLLEGIVKRGAPGSANNNFKIIRRMFSFAVQRDILKTSPCIGVSMPAPLIRKDRFLNEEEIKTFWTNLDTCHASNEVRRALRLILLTGQRPGEVIGMSSSEIDGNIWTIPASRAKNKREHRVYLTKTALELIGPLQVLDEQTKKVKPKGFIFPCPHSAKIQHIENTVPAQVIRLNMSVPVMFKGKPVFDRKGQPVTENLLGVSDFTPHDLRRTCATFLSKIGFMDEIIDAVLNHTKQGIIRTYNVNRYEKEIQQALESWERKLTAILSCSTSNVIPITRKAA